GRAQVGLVPPDRRRARGGPRCRGGRLLAEDREVAEPPAMLANEIFALNEPPARAAARVVHATLIGLDHLDQQPDDASGRVELSTLLPLGAGELTKEVLVGTPQDVL